MYANTVATATSVSSLAVIYFTCTSQHLIAPTFSYSDTGYIPLKLHSSTHISAVKCESVGREEKKQQYPMTYFLHHIFQPFSIKRHNLTNIRPLELSVVGMFIFFFKV